MLTERARVRSVVVLGVAAMCLVLSGGNNPAAAQAPMGTVFTYQGELSSGGGPIDEPLNGCDFEFTLWDADIDGSQLGPTLTPNALVAGGRFTLALDFGDNIFTGAARWLEIAVCCPAGCEDFTTLAPRQELTPAPYSLALPALRTTPSGNGDNPESASIIGGHPDNGVNANVAGAIVAGGGGSSATNGVSSGAHFATVSGGRDNLVSAGGYGGTIGGGQSNRSFFNATVAGGVNNIADGSYSSIGGGSSGNATGTYSTIGGGHDNFASDTGSTVGGGRDNTASGFSATVPGGNNNTGAGAYSFAAGRRSKANHNGAFVWGDSENADVSSTAVDQFLIRAAGGVGIGTTSPTEQLDVAGNIHSSGTISSGNSIIIDGVAHTITSNGDLELHVNDGRALRLETNATSPNLIGGYSGNSVEAGTVGATIAGGGATSEVNRVFDDYATVSGGKNNQAGSDDANPLSALYASVGGGFQNTASGQTATVSGGVNNTASNLRSTVGGGNGNEASGSISTVGGGQQNTASGSSSTVSGGVNNTASGADWATVAGGNINEASGIASTVGGGLANTASGDYSNAAGGRENAASSFYATVSGGQNNAANGNNSFIGGGFVNIASGYASTVGGGQGNVVSADYSTISGGGESTPGDSTTSNKVFDGYGTVSGGGNNKAGSDDADPTTAIFATVGGGFSNTASETSSTVGGGAGNHASGTEATVGAGFSNTASGDRSTVGGGNTNEASGQESTIGGGDSNEASGQWSTIGGGSENTASGDYATVVGGGISNEASGDWATVGGGHQNTAGGDYSFAAGRKANADHDGTFVWADTTNVDFTSTEANQFLIRAAGGVGIGTPSPTEQLDVAGNIHASGTITSGSSITIDGTTDTIMATGGTLSFDDENLTTSGQIESTMGGFKLPDGTIIDDASDLGGDGGTLGVPVGTVTAWLKSFPNTPSLQDGWAECNGQVLSDPDSVYDGQTIPPLNSSTEGAKRFLRGSTTSGSVGGSTSHSHGQSCYDGQGSICAANDQGAGHIPPYYEVVWIMKVK